MIREKIYWHIGGPLTRSDWVYGLFLVLATNISTAAWLLGTGVL